MSSHVVSAALYLQQIGFCQVASAAALLYDYLLLFGSEVDLIWTPKWNLVTLLYAIVRYLSFFLILYGCSHLYRQRELDSKSLAWYQIRMWGPFVFRAAMDLIMMKRIHALSLTPNRFLSKPKWIFVFMAITFTLKYASSITLLFLGIGVGSHLSSIEAEFAGIYVCGTMIPMENFLMASQLPTLCFEIILFILAFGYFIADIWDNYQRNNRWKVNDLVQILVRDSTVYFAINLVASALNVGNWKINAPNVYLALSMALQAFIPFCFAPRLVINVKQHTNRVHMSEIGGDFPLRNQKFDEEQHQA